MAWYDEAVPMLRILIGDYGDESTDMIYSTNRLEEILVVAAKYVSQEIDFDTTYTVSINPYSISPDPNSDSAFTNFMVMKAACLTDQGTFRSKALSAGIKAKCGPVVLETLRYLDGFKELLTLGPCATYKTMKKDWMFGNGNICKAILSPFVGNNFDPQSLSAFTTHRDRF